MKSLAILITLSTAAPALAHHGGDHTAASPTGLFLGLGVIALVATVGLYRRARA